MKRLMAEPLYAVAETNTGGNPRDAFRAAFGAAKASHLDALSKEEAGDDAGAEETDDADPDAESVADEEADAESESPAAPAKPAAKGAKAEDDEPERTAESTGLISDEDFKAIQRKHPNDTVAQKKALEAVFTQKTQKLAEERRSYERLAKYADLVDAFESDADGTLKQLASYYGYKLVGGDAGDDAAEPEPRETATAADPADSEALLGEIREALGPELEYQAEALAKVFEKVLGKQVNARLAKEIEPLRKSTKTLLDTRADEETTRVMASFEHAHPDYKLHEAAMLDLAQTLSPKGMTESQFLELLYKTATRDAWEAEKDTNIEREVAARLKKRVKRLSAASPEDDRREDTTPNDQVRRKARADMTFAEAYQAAKRGERLEDDDDD